MHKLLTAIILTSLLSACGSVKHYYHGDTVFQTRPAGTPLETITIEVGQDVKLLKHTQGLMWGGYIQGVAIEDPDIVSLRFGKDNSNSFDPTVYIKGLKPGVTRAVYCNRIGERPDFSNPLPRDFEESSFQIIVR